MIPNYHFCVAAHGGIYFCYEFNYAILIIASPLLGLSSWGYPLLATKLPGN